MKCVDKIFGTGIQNFANFYLFNRHFYDITINIVITSRIFEIEIFRIWTLFPIYSSIIIFTIKWTLIPTCS